MTSTPACLENCFNAFSARSAGISNGFLVPSAPRTDENKAAAITRWWPNERRRRRNETGVSGGVILNKTPQTEKSVTASWWVFRKNGRFGRNRALPLARLAQRDRVTDAV